MRQTPVIQNFLQEEVFGTKVLERADGELMRKKFSYWRKCEDCELNSVNKLQSSDKTENSL